MGGGFGVPVVGNVASIDGDIRCSRAIRKALGGISEATYELEADRGLGTWLALAKPKARRRPRAVFHGVGLATIPGGKSSGRGGTRRRRNQVAP